MPIGSALPRLSAVSVLVLMACAPSPDAERGTSDGAAVASTTVALQDSTHRLFSIEGLDGPEAVRYDPDQDVYFVSNFAGDGGERDANGFITRASAEGAIETLRFAVGTGEAPLHAPRGMFITGDTLWAADADGVHGFDRRTGAHRAFVDFRSFEPGFLNDVAAGPEGTLYVTDTGRSRVYSVRGRQVAVAVEDALLGPPNGIARDAAGDRFVLASWSDDPTIRAWRSGGTGLEDVVTLASGGHLDGIEVMDGGILVASQDDTSIHLAAGGSSRAIIRTPGRPADIAVDTRRGRVAVPYVALNRVDVWALPGR